MKDFLFFWRNQYIDQKTARPGLTRNTPQERTFCLSEAQKARAHIINAGTPCMRIASENLHTEIKKLMCGRIAARNAPKKTPNTKAITIKGSTKTHQSNSRGPQGHRRFLLCSDFLFSNSSLRSPQTKALLGKLQHSPVVYSSCGS